MAQLIVRNLKADVKERLRQRARRRGRSMEAEAREILSAAVRPDRQVRHGLGTEIAGLFEPAGLTDPIPELRGGRLRIPDFEG